MSITQSKRGLTQGALWGWFFIALVIITSSAVLTAYSPLYANGLVNILIPFLILVFFKAEVFEKVKLSTLMIGRILVVVTFLGFMSGSWLVPIIVWLLRLNILEAMIADVKNKNYYNIISGAVLLATSFFITGAWQGTYYLTNNAGMLYWALAYTIWNWNFVIHEFKNQIGFYHVAVLTAPLLVVAVTGNPGWWLIMRANTLTLAGIVQITRKKYLERVFDSPIFDKALITIKSRSVQIILMALAVMLCGVSVIIWMR